MRLSPVRRMTMDPTAWIRREAQAVQSAQSLFRDSWKNLKNKIEMFC